MGKSHRFSKSRYLFTLTRCMNLIVKRLTETRTGDLLDRFISS